MENKFSKIVMLFVIVFSLAACTAKTTETPTESETTEKSKRGGGQKGKRPQFADLLAKMDTNKDGKLAKSEVKGRLQDNFAKADTNGDGFITEDEFKNMAPPKRGQR